jgi:NADP-dependent 3-hydroxy acid dehydrogenase YdfG
MANTILICGYGPGISESVARKFGAEGFQVALVARNEAKVVQAAEALTQAGIKARGFGCDVGDPVAVKKLITDVRGAVGPISVLHWNAYGGRIAGDLTQANVSALRATLDVAVTGLTVAMQETLTDLRAATKPAILVTGGALCSYDAKMDAMAAQWGVMGLGVAKAAQHKLVGVLNAKLKGVGIYVGEVTVGGIVKSAGSDRGTLEASAIAERFWQIYEQRSEVWVSFPG